MNARTYHWIILAVAIFSAAATLFQLYGVYMMSLAHLPGVYASFANSIREASDIDALKTACLGLAARDEESVDATWNWIVYSPLIALATSVSCAAIAGWALAATRREKLNDGGR